MAPNNIPWKIFIVANKDDTKQLRRDISFELKIHINSGQKPEFEHQMHNHLPNQEEHKDHILEEPTDPHIPGTNEDVVQS